MALDSLREHCERQRIEAKQLIFDTGTFGEGKPPFLFADIELRRFFFLELKGLDTDAPGTRLPLASHLFVKSTAGSLLRNPASTLHRLFFLGTSNVYDLIHPATFMPRGSAEPPPLWDGPGMDLEKWETDLDRLTRTRSSMGTIRYLVDGDEFFPRFTEAIVNAEAPVHIRIYIFDRDEYTVRLADLLKRRSEEIDIRLLTDGIGTLAAESGLKVDVNLPPDLKSMPRYLKKDSKVKVRVQANPVALADHVKTILIDREVVFTGGMNIGREYRYQWHDLMLELHGPVVNQLQREFDRRWAISGSMLLPGDPAGLYGAMAISLLLNKSNLSPTTVVLPAESRFAPKEFCFLKSFGLLVLQAEPPSRPPSFPRPRNFFRFSSKIARKKSARRAFHLQKTKIRGTAERLPHPALTLPEPQSGERATMLLGPSCEVVDAPFDEERRAWEGLI